MSVLKVIYRLTKLKILGTLVVVQWLRLQAPNTEDMGLIPDWGTKILYATWLSQKNFKILTV